MKRKQRTAGGAEIGDIAAGAAAAVGWFNRFLETDLSTLPPEELAEWAEWSERPAHLEQFRLTKRISLSAQALDVDPRPTQTEIAADEYDGSVPMSEWIERSSGRSTERRLGFVPKIPAIAAGLGLLAVTVMIFAYLHVGVFGRPPSDQIRSYSTGPSEHRLIELPDGSSVTLGARTELSTHYTASRRVIFLERGEAWFAVAHNPTRPFTVLAGGGAITAIGTQFDVRRELDAAGADRVIVTVDNGTVEVGPPSTTIPQEASDAINTSNTRDRGAMGATGDTRAVHRSRAPTRPADEWTPARLVKGQELTYSADGPEGKIELVNLDEVSAWKYGRLEYRHTPLKLVIPRVSRYSQKEIVLADGVVGELPFSGTVFEGQVADWLHALEAAYPIEVTETDDRYLIRYRRDRDDSR
jgi:transmembrane sensor